MAILDTGLLLAFTVLLALSSATSAEVKECAQTQYIEIGTVGLIPCSCNGSSMAIIAWVNADERKTLLLLHNGEKSGDGYESGEYDIYPNGSLLINNVTASHESVYRVSTAISISGFRISKNICVHTTVKPATTIPVIEECSNTYGTTCVKSTADSVEINCFVRDSRPAVKLGWTIRTHGGDHILPSIYRNFTTDNVTYTSHVTATFSFGESSVLSLLVCIANSVPLKLVEDENVLLIEKEIDYTSLTTPIRRNVKIHSPMNLSCTYTRLILVVWKWSPQQAAFETLYVSIFPKSNHTKIGNKDYKLEDAGSLSLQNTLVEHEGFYACVYDSGINGGVVLYDLLVMVDPTPVFPVIDGCNHQQYCVLEKQPQDVLTCSVLGIRPKVALEWRAFREETVIDFTQHQLTVTQMGDLYDISLTVNVDFTQTTHNKVTVECRAVGENAELFSLSTKVDLLFPYVLPTEQRSYTFTITIIAVLVTMIIITAAVVIRYRIRARKMKRIKRGGTENEIPISDLYLEWSFSGFEGKDIRLESGLCLSSLSSVEKISINAGKQKQEFTEEEVIELINYGIKSTVFKGLWLYNFELPSSIKPDVIPEESRSRNIKVISSGEALYLDLMSGKWSKPDDIHTITEMCSGGLTIDRDTSESVQRSVIELMVEASNSDIPINRVTLAWSFSKTDEDGIIILSSGLSLPILTSIKMMHIQTEEGGEMNEHEVNGILSYVQHSERFEELDLFDCLLPSSIPFGPSLSALKSRGVKVIWIPDSHKQSQQYLLDHESGGWLKYEPL